jgi:hypothetical protein
MKATLTVGDGALTFEVAGEKAKDIWAQVAQIQELFEAEIKCGLCACDELRYGHRVTKVGGFNYYELVCRACGGVFSFGQRRDTLDIFPKRRDADGKPLLNGGWRKWEDRDTDDGDFEAPPPAPAPRPSQHRAPVPPVVRPVPARTPARAGSAHSAKDLRHDAGDFESQPPVPQWP